jgi:molybdenum cofactor guanylyltransferase
MCCNPNVYDESNPLLGVVLSGGNSSRMGEDKGLLVKDGSKWVNSCSAKLEQLGIPVIVSINSSQLDAYKAVFNPENLVIDKIPVKGPLGGVLSVHDKYPDCDLVVLACDLQDVTFAAIRDLVNEYRERAGEHDFFVYNQNQEPEPLLGVYTAEGLKKIFSLFLSGELHKFSMKYMLDVGNTYSIDLGQEKWGQFKNYNFRADLKG